MKGHGVVKKILSMEINRYREANKLYLSQKKYIEKVLEHFGMQGSKLVSTSLVAHFKLSSALSPQMRNEGSMSHIPYVSATRSIMYAIVCNRLNISHVVSVVSRYMDHPRKIHW